MNYSSRSDRDMLVYSLHGKLMGGPDADPFHDDIRAECAKSPKKVILDLSDVEWMNSWGVGLLVSVYTTAQNTGSRLRVAACAPKVCSVLRLTQFDKVLEMFPTVDDATRDFDLKTANMN